MSLPRNLLRGAPIFGEENYVGESDGDAGGDAACQAPRGSATTAAPPWTSLAGLSPPPRRLHLGRLATPVAPWLLPASLGVPDGCKVQIKRDDLTGAEIGGNKIRKLEFLLMEARDRGADAIVTVGGAQSNHARATASACAALGLPCHLVLRTTAHGAGRCPGMTGNVLIDRLVGATIHQVSKSDYARTGGDGLGALLAQRLIDRGLATRPYVIPVGGSNPLGVWGYLDGAAEIAECPEARGVTDVVAACGSGATLAGLALGLRLAALHEGRTPPRVTAYAVCDSEDYFHSFVDGLLAPLLGDATGAASGADLSSRSLMRVVVAKGAGYAVSTAEELDDVRRAAKATGVVLDPVYTGKALHGMLTEMRTDPADWAQRSVLFVHTGGLLGVAAEAEALREGVGQEGELRGGWERLPVPGGCEE